MPWSTKAAPERGGGLLAAYRAGGTLARPLLARFLRQRAARGKEDAARLGERFGETAVPRPDGPLLWVHAASVGETNMMLPLVASIAASGPKILFTTVTVTSASIAAARLPAGAIHQYSPLDVPAWTTRFLDHWRPDLALFAESELWPGILGALAERNVPLALVNARLSAGSFRRWQRLGRIGRSLFSPVTLCLAQGEEHADRYRRIGLRNVAVTGNLKFDVPAPRADAAELERLRGVIGERPVWVAASTHEGEETMAAAVHRDLAARLPGLLTIIVPRHPQRGEAIAGALRADGHGVTRRGAGEDPGPATGIYLADTLGELGLFYRLAPVAFVGGSLVRHGGQNPIEPVKLGAAVLHGPEIANFTEVYAALDAADPQALVGDREALGRAVVELAVDPAARRARAGLAAAALRPFAGALETTLEALRPLLDPLTGKLEAARR